MTLFSNWCASSGLTSIADQTVSKVVGTITSQDDDAGIDLIATRLPEVYADTTALALIAERYGKPDVAAFLRHRLPTKKSSRSGDMGEILATAYLAEERGYVVGPSRLIDRDHQEWAMRGDDVLAARVHEDSKVHLVRAEAKSRVRLGQKTVEEAREGLTRNDEMPSPHSLSQFAHRLLAGPHHEIGEAVIHLQLIEGVRSDRVGHLMFLLTSGDPSSHVAADLTAYAGIVPQLTITLSVQDHQKFINDTYDKVVSDGA